MRFFLSMLYPALVLPFYLRWSRQQAESQIDRMQAAVFDTPGVEAPIPSSVVWVGVSLIAGHFLLGRRLLRLRAWQSVLSLLVGVAVGLGLFQAQARNPD